MIDLPFALEVDNLHMIHWCVNASFVVHPPLKMYEIGFLKMGWINFIYLSKKKINSKTSIEVELVGVYGTITIIV